MDKSTFTTPELPEPDDREEPVPSEETTKLSAVDPDRHEPGDDPDRHEPGNATVEIPSSREEPVPPWLRPTRTTVVREPVPFTEERVGRPERGRWLLAAIAIAALLLSLLSLGVNYLLIQQLQTARTETRAMLDDAIAGLDDATLGDFEFSYVFSDTVEYSGTMPVSETIVFPFRGTVPFRGRVPFQGVVPIVINIPLLGPQEISIPVDTTVNVDTEVEVDTTVTVPIAMDFPFNVAMPVEVPVDLTISLDEQPAFQGLLDEIREALVEFRDRALQ